MSKIFKKIYNYIASFGTDPDKLAQMGHFLAGVVVADWFGPWGCLVFFGAWITPKEAYVDTKPPENAPFFWNGAKDMGFYCLGMGVGLVRRYLQG